MLLPLQMTFASLFHELALFVLVTVSWQELRDEHILSAQKNNVQCRYIENNANKVN
jgi:hypothetical protein